ncbi:hypothetical protein S40293_11512 [Stachybotrys chartarum IBT 40293]|nr:hypothetical protein S40293_11512 [Stachybotrys chartarum IBT 40293]
MHNPQNHRTPTT